MRRTEAEAGYLANSPGPSHVLPARRAGLAEAHRGVAGATAEGQDRPRRERVGAVGRPPLPTAHGPPQRLAFTRLPVLDKPQIDGILTSPIRGTYVNVDPFHLIRYVDEQAFRYNNRKDVDGARFRRVVASITGKRLTYGQLIAATTTPA